MHLGGLVEGAGLLRSDDGDAGADGVGAPGQPGDHFDRLGVAVGFAEDLAVKIHYGIAADDGGAGGVALQRPDRRGLAQGERPDRFDGAGAGGDVLIAVDALHRKVRGDDREQLPAAGAGAAEDDLFHGGHFLWVIWRGGGCGPTAPRHKANETINPAGFRSRSGRRAWPGARCGGSAG